MLAMYKKRSARRTAQRERPVSANLAAIAYLISGVLFILALRGLSSPVTSRRGNRFGMIGMALAVATTLLTLWGRGALDPITLLLIGAGVAVGGAVGAIAARRIAMTAMPQLVAAFHSLVGLAACLVAVAALHPRRLRHRGGRRGREAGIPHRAVPRRGDRRGHFHRLADRLRQVERQHVGRRSCCPSAIGSTSSSAWRSSV